MLDTLSSELSAKTKAPGAVSTRRPYSKERGTKSDHCVLKPASITRRCDAEVTPDKQGYQHANPKPKLTNATAETFRLVLFRRAPCINRGHPTSH
jgi:hypothetical protein